MLTSDSYCLVYEDFLKLYFPFLFFRINIVHYLNEFYLFSISRNKLMMIDYLLRTFLVSRSCLTSMSLFFPDTLYSGLNLFGWKFFISRSGKFLGAVSLDNLRNYKSRLKLVIKSSLFIQPFIRLKKLNSLIFDWCSIYGFSDVNYDVFGYLDVYLYKLLWNWAKRRHPRRPSTWVYSKYWRFFPSLNLWRFYFLDYSLSKCLFLRLHVPHSVNVYYIPSSLNSFSLKDYNKVGLNWVKKCSHILSGLHLFLYKSQSGKCFCCGKFFNQFSNDNIKVFRLCVGSSSITRYVLLHINCYVRFYLFKNLLF